MEYFEYKVRNAVSGKVSKGIMTADDLESAVDTLKRRGENIVEIDYLKDFMNLRKLSFSLSTRISKKIAAEFYTMLSFMLEAGMSLHESLITIRDSSISKKLKRLSSVTADEVRKGEALSGAMKRSGLFPHASTEQIRAGEESGTVTTALKRLISQTEKELEFTGKLKNAMVYPIVICVVMVAVLWVLMTVVVPSLSATLIEMGGELPLITKIVIGTSNFMSAATPYLIVITIAGIITYKILIKNSSIKYKVDTNKLKIPIVGTMLEKIELSRFCRNLSAMQASGITLVTSLKIVDAAIKNTNISRAIHKACRLIEISGMNLGTALSKSGNFPSLMLQLIEVGISSGQICDVLDKIALQYEKEVDFSLKRVTSLIEPIMIVIVGLLAGTVVVSIFIPMFSIAGQF